jgi:microcystin-dependent protein
MADTTTPLLGLLLMGTGGDNNAWGTNLNTQVITLLENAVAGITTLSVTGGSHPLTTTEARSATIILTGTLTSDQTIVVPGTAKKWTFVNQCSGSFFVIVKAGSGSGCNVPAATSKDITCTDANTVIRKDRDQVGRFFYHAGTSAPAGAFECNGALPLRASVIDLFNEIGTTWGVGDGFTTFKLPNGEDTNRFLRAAGSGLTVGTYQANQNLSHVHSFTGSLSAGSLSTDSQGSHIHSISDNGHVHVLPSNTAFFTGGAAVTGGTGAPINLAGGTTTANATTNISIVAAGAHSHNVTGAPGLGTLALASNGGTEARPESLVGLLCINY